MPRSLLQAALNGPRHPSEHPALPITPQQLAAAAADAIMAGASAIHFHVRGPDGRESLAADDLTAALGGVRAAVRGTPVGLSTGAWILGDPTLRLAAVERWIALPDFASVNFDEAGAVTLARLLRSRGIGVEAGVATRQAAERLVDSGLGPQCLRVLLEPREQDVESALATVVAVEALLDRGGIRRPRLLHGTETTVWSLVAAAVARGYDTRVGLEDTLLLPDGHPAPGNAALVSAARALGASTGGP